MSFLMGPFKDKFRDGTVAFAVRIDHAIAFQGHKERPAKVSDKLEVLKAGIPRIPKDASGRKTTHSCGV